MKPFTVSVDMEDVSVVLKSFINGRTASHAYVDQFLVTYLRFRPRAECSNPEDAFRFWQMLDVRPDLVDTFVSMDLDWDGEFFYVNEFWRHVEDSFH